MIHNKTLNKKTMEKIKNYTEFKFKALDILEEENEIIGKVEMKFAYIIYINFDISIKESLEISKEDITPQFDERLNKNKI